MLFVSVLRNALFILVPLSIALTSYLYLYPVFHLCAFPSPNQDASSSYLNTFRQHIPSLHHEPTAHFRLLALGDPQLEGDTSLNPDAASFPNLSKFWKDALLLEGTEHTLLQRIRHSLHDLVDFYFEDIPNILEYYRKRLDLRGNDYYLAHIYRTLHWWTKPTHVSVLGDLVGSQWITDEEFETRGHRYWNRVFKHGKRVADELASQPDSSSLEKTPTMILGEDMDWNRRIINIAGNHDIGYAGDLTPERLSRFERMFGKANYELKYRLPEKNTNQSNSEIDGLEIGDKVPPELRIVVLNDMNLDSPVTEKDLQEQTYTFLNNIITTSAPVTQPAHFTLILTHIPLFKPDGVCVDGPFFEYHHDGSGIKEQNHLSQDASKGFLEGLLGMSGNKDVDGGGIGRKGLIINGHDHEGCDVWHFINQSSTDSSTTADNVNLALNPDDNPQTPSWQATTYPAAESLKLPSKISSDHVPGTREITLRSMMGDFGGSAGLLSLWFDTEIWDWKYEFQTCALGKQHIWWVVHVLDLITLGVGLVLGLVKLVAWGMEQGKRKGKRQGKNGANGKEMNGMPKTMGNGTGIMDGSKKRSHALRKKKSKQSVRGFFPSL